jgi:hypothetical protein
MSAANLSPQTRSVWNRPLRQSFMRAELSLPATPDVSPAVRRSANIGQPSPFGAMRLDLGHPFARGPAGKILTL